MRFSATAVAAFAGLAAAQCPMVADLQTTNDLVAQTHNTLASWTGSWAGMTMVAIPTVVRTTQMARAISSISHYNGGVLSEDCANQVLQALQLNHQQRDPVRDGIIGSKEKFVALSSTFNDAGQLACYITGYFTDGVHSAIKNAMPDDDQKAQVQQLWDAATDDLNQIYATYSA